MRRFLLWLIAAGGLLAQSGIEVPLAGYIRDGAGALRPVHGVAGSFQVGAPILTGVVAVLFNGNVGLARTGEGLFAFDKAGRLFGPVDGEWEAPPCPIFTDGDELVFRKGDGTEIRAKIDGAVLGIEQAGEEWFAVHQPDRLLAVRLAGESLEIWRLPEASQ
jgi:hypothetical protein